MPYIYNLQRTRQLRRRLRNASTKTEYLLWQRLRRRQANGFKFRRQFGIRGFVVDFYCPQIKLAVEIDGGVHGYAQQQEHDARRQEYLTALGIHMIRFTDIEILNDIDHVLDILASKCFTLLPSQTRPPLTPPDRPGGGASHSVPNIY